MSRFLLYNIQKKVRLFSHLFFVISALSITVTQAPAQNTATFNEPGLEAAYQSILKLKFKEGKEMLQRMDHTRNPTPVYFYVQNLADILLLLVTEDKELFNTLSANEDKRIAAVATFSDDEPYKLFCLAEMQMQWAFIKLKYGEELSALWNLRQAYKTIKKNQEQFPDFLPNNKSIGLLHILFGAVPDQYQWALNILGISGSIKEGMKELAILSRNASPFNTEAVIIKSLAQGYILQDFSAAFNGINQLYQSSPDNLLVNYLYALMLIKNSNGEQALIVLREAQALREGYPTFPMLKYLKGEVLLQKGEYNAASTHYAQFLLTFKGGNFVKDANFKLFLCHWLNNEDQLAEQYFIKAKTAGKTVTEADKYANRLLSSNEHPNKILMKIRLFTDGGYYEKAAELIDNLEVNNFERQKDQAELVYRKARLYHKQDQMNEAIPLYKRTITISGKNNWYFAPNAALQLGYIYSQLKQQEPARAFFEKAISYKDHPYKNSIDHKAKAGLVELE